jgi:hypothetical protein
MGWSNCGTDSKGRPIGYAHEAVCDYDGCNNVIDRGLSYACGGMHGHNGVDCDGYYCPQHLRTFVEHDGHECTVCDTCLAHMQADKDWVEDREEGVWRYEG